MRRAQSDDVDLVCYRSEHDHLGLIRSLIDEDLSEPYSIFTYRYFLLQWSDLCFLALTSAKAATPSEDVGIVPNICVGCVVCKMERHREWLRGYIAMVAVRRDYRRHGLGTRLIHRAMEAMTARGCVEVVLETETSNLRALRMYERLGFLREKRLERYYLNGSDAFRLRRVLVKDETDGEAGRVVELDAI